MSRPRALENIRVVDFSWVRAGPWATRWLGALGAEIIKIEWPENERGRLPSTTTPQNLEINLNTSGNFNDTNVNKKSLSLNVRSAKGLENVNRLIAISDIVIENFSSRVLQKWGLGYEELRKIKPDIVYVSMSGYGHTGRHHHYTTFGPVAQAVAGLTYISGLPDKPPAGWGWSYTTWQPIAETAETEHGRDLARQSAAVNLEVANRHVMLHGHVVDRQRCQTLFDFL
jgi:crotonobetainyl-CoA:carnitine CoA-transferase CaiB-like acyl-CoA transferase